MKTGWQNIDGKTYYFDENNTEGRWGTKHKGWLKKQKTNGIGYNWYYFNEKGDIVTGWYEKEPNAKYYFSDSHTDYGVMKTGEVNINGVTYYFNSDGTLAKNTIQ
jgi:glucan-binding YG repeat protein